MIKSYKNLLLIIAGILLVGIFDAHARSIHEAKVSAPRPFDLVLGKSSLDDSKATWNKNNAEVTGQGYGEAKPSYIDNDPDGVANERVQLFDVSGLPLDRLQTARFGFFDNVLYLIKYQFQEGADFDKIKSEVIMKYGPPQAHDGFGDEYYTWHFAGGVTLSLKKDFMGKHEMIFLHEPTLKLVQASNQSVYRENLKKKAKVQNAF